MCWVETDGEGRTNQIDQTKDAETVRWMDFYTRYLHAMHLSYAYMYVRAIDGRPRSCATWDVFGCGN
jgi:hypothetical protein